MLEPLVYLCGLDTDPYNALCEVNAFSPDQAAEEYCLMYEGGWAGDHFNLTEEEPRKIQVVYQEKLDRYEVYYFEVRLAEDDDKEYVLKEVKGGPLPFSVSIGI